MKVRIVQDSWNRFFVQARRWYWPFWLVVRYDLTEDEALAVAKRLKNPLIVYVE